jgi:hypothetical protein
MVNEMIQLRASPEENEWIARKLQRKADTLFSCSKRVSNGRRSSRF